VPYTSFRGYFPEIAEHETRAVTVVSSSAWGLPPAMYGLHEMYCDEPGCDCRRVFLCVVSDRNNNVEAVVAYGWESPDFYIKWFGDDDPTLIKELMGPSLNLASPQSELAPAILKMVRYVLKDEAYIERIKRHYQMFRQVIDKKGKVAAKKKTSRKKRKR
jgi:hypothetical protein